MPLDNLFNHAATKHHATRLKDTRMTTFFDADPLRFERYSIQGPEIFLDYSKNRIDDAALASLIKLCDDAQLTAAIESMFTGKAINTTENRAVLHTALRSKSSAPLFVDGKNIRDEISAARHRVYDFVDLAHQGKLKGFTGAPITSLVSIGIGGSYLGPVLANDALAAYKVDGIDVHFVANIDGADLHQTLSKIEPETTLFLVQSKSFGTLETLENANAAKQWLLTKGASQGDIKLHFAAVSSNIEAARGFGIEADRVFPMWDWVGGRYSLWSAIGLPIVFLIGRRHFEAFLGGAYEMDEHFRHAPFSQNIPVMMGLVGVWYNNYLGSTSQAIIPYDHHLANLPAYLQQLDMESNGKAVDLQGNRLEERSGPVIWGGVGCNGQHAYHQLLHQGSQVIPVDFIIALKPQHPIANHHRLLFANCLAQSQAMMNGKSQQNATQELIDGGMSRTKADALAPHKYIPGNKPSNTVILKQLNPKSLGALIALYEHKVFVQGVLWGINSFDQWGVELGKSLADDIYSALGDTNSVNQMDASTEGLIRLFQGQS